MAGWGRVGRGAGRGWVSVREEEGCIEGRGVGVGRGGGMCGSVRVRAARAGSWGARSGLCRSYR